MPLDPDIAAYLERAAAAGQPPYEQQSVADAREQYVRLMAARRGADYQPAPMHSVVDRACGSAGHEIPLRVYTPPDRAAGDGGRSPGVVFLHGGGWVIGDLDTHDGVARDIASGLGAVVVSVDYRRAPEAPFPAALEDAQAATLWAAEHAEELRIDAARLVVAGDSAGGGMAAVVARRARDAGGPPIAAQLLLYPVTDVTMSSDSYRGNAQGYGLTATTMAWFIAHSGAQPDDPDASPLTAADLSGLPPAVVTTAGFDPLRDEGDAYAKALASAGVEVCHLAHPRLIHGYAGMAPTIPAARAALTEDLAALASLTLGQRSLPPTRSTSAVAP